MKKLMLILTLILVISRLNAQITTIPDPNFEQVLIAIGIDSDGIVNGQVLTADIENVIELDVNSNEIQDLTGIEGFTALENLNIQGNHLSTINLTTNLNLKILNCKHNWLIDLDLSNNILLEELYCGNFVGDDVYPQNEFESLDLSNNTSLKILDIDGIFELTSLNISTCSHLEMVNAAFTGLSDINLNNNTNLISLWLGYFLDDPDGNIYYSNLNLMEIDLSNNTSLENLYSPYTYLEKINLKNGTNTILTVNTTNSPNLYCIQVDDEVAASNGNFPYSNWQVDPQVVFTEEECLLSISETENVTIELFPNPVNEILYINIQNCNYCLVQIYTSNGILLYNESLKAAHDTIDVKDLSTGIYFLVMENDIGKKQIQKFVKK